MTDQEMPARAPERVNPKDYRDSVRRVVDDVVQSDQIDTAQGGILRIRGKKERLEQAMQEDRIEQNRDAEADRLLGDIQNEYQPTVDAHALEQAIGDYAERLAASIEDFDSDTALTELADSLFQQYEEMLRQPEPDTDQAEKLTNAARFIRKTHDAIQSGDYDQIVRKLEELRLHQAAHVTLFDRKQATTIQATLIPAYVSAVVSRHTTNGQRDNRAIAQELYRASKSYGFETSFSSKIKGYLDADLATIAGEAQADDAAQQYMRQFSQGRSESGYRLSSRFQVSDEEMGKLLGIDPWGIFEGELRKYEAGQSVDSDLAVAAAFQKINQLIEYVNSESFQLDWAEDKFKRPNRSQMRDFDIQRFRELVRSRVNARINAHNMRLAIQTGDFQRIFQFADRLGSGGWFNALKQNRAHVALNLIEQRFEQLRLVHTQFTDEAGTVHEYTDTVRIIPRIITNMLSGLEEEVRTSYELYGYSNPDDALAGLRTAYNLFVVSQRQAYHSSLGKGPIEGHEEEYKHPFEALPDNQFAATFNALDFGMEQNFLFDKQQRKWFVKLIEFMGDEKKLTTQQKQQLGKQRMRDIIQIYDVFSSGWRTQKELDQLEKLYVLRYSQRAAAQRRPGETEEQARRRGRQEGLAVFKTIALGIKLKRAGQDYRWEFDQDEFVGKKDELEKAWKLIGQYRPQEIIKIMAEKNHYTMKQNKNGEWVYDYVEGIPHPFLDKTVKKRKLDHSKEHVIDKLLATYRFTNEKGDQLNNYKRLEDFIMPVVSVINNLLGAQRDERGVLIRPGLAAIDYHAGINALSSEQKQVVDYVFHKKFGANARQAKERYFGIMQTLSKFTLNDGVQIKVNSAQQTDAGGNIHVINELMENGLYEDVYRNNIRFLDDARLVEMIDLDPEEIGPDLVPIADEFYMGEGTGANDMFRRAWNDMSAAVQALEALKNMATTLDPNDLLGQQLEFDRAVKGIEGWQQARTGAARVIGAWINAAKAPNIANFTYLSKLPLYNRSEFQRIFGRGAPVLDPDDVMDMRNALQEAGVFAYVPKDLREKLIGKTGIMSGEIFMLHKGWTMFIILAIFILQSAFQESQRGAEEAER